ncbi:MAG: hypothetical protein R6W90_17535, partial [Ignavibacteriaceae bacterium]
MKINIYITVFVCLFGGILFGQQNQEGEDPFYYQVAGLVYVKEFDRSSRDTTSVRRIPKEPLRFRIVSNEFFGTDNKADTICVIQFLEIKNDSFDIKIKALNVSFITSNDNNEYFWLRKKDLDNYMRNNFIQKSYMLSSIPKFTYGARVSLPFKFRPSIGDENRKITPQVTLGGFLDA